MVSAAGAGAQGRPLWGAPAMSRVRPAARVLPVALLLGWGADVLFWGHRPGLNASPLFTALILVALFFLARLEGVRPAWRNLWVLAPLLFFATTVAVRANELLTALNLPGRGGAAHPGGPVRPRRPAAPPGRDGLPPGDAAGGPGGPPAAPPRRWPRSSGRGFTRRRPVPS